MATFVFFHAHPDDEAIATGGTMAAAADAGHRVVLVLATRGEHGEVPEGFLRPGESLAERRVRETEDAAAVLGVAAVELLGYVDSGMMGTPENDAPGSFWSADVDEAANRLAAILRREAADVLTVYDEHGNYGHPDHIQVHRVGVRAAELVAVERVYEATMNRDHVRRRIEHLRAASGEPADLPADVDLDTFGVPESAITTAVDVLPWIERKRRAMQAHASQIAETSFFLSMPADAFAHTFGTEWYVRRGATTPVSRWERWLL